jgi:rSAM/selenodomain-associated transferase 1
MSAMAPPVRIVIIAKAPQPGYAKTRLIPALGAQGAAALAQQMLCHAVHIALQAGVGTVELCAAPDRDDPAWAALALPSELTWSDQGEGDLGERMARAAQRALNRGESVLLIGTDCPQMDASHLKGAATSLQTHHACLTPTLDGGYALLGLNQFHGSLFDDMPWSTAVVAAETRRRAAAISWTLHLMMTLRDVDEPDDLLALPPGWIARPDFTPHPHSNPHPTLNTLEPS